MAGKAENTKYGKKTRETYSGTDWFREILSEVEKNLSQMIYMFSGISLKEDTVKLEYKIHKIASKMILNRFADTI